MAQAAAGPLFKEWTLPRNSISAQRDHNWSRRRPYPLFTPRGARGPRSLLDMVTNVVANNIGDVTMEHMEATPTRLLWHIWHFLEARGICLHAWKLFSVILLREEEEKTLGLYHFRQHICRPEGNLLCFTKPIISPSIEFITHLVLSGGCSFDTHEMLCLTDIKNLGILELIQPADETRTAFPEITDRLVRGWTEKDNPFPLLRILRIWGDESTTQQSLQYVSKFPSLVLYDVMGSRQDWTLAYQHASESDWELADSLNGGGDSLLQYLMLFAPSEKPDMKRLRELARRIDSDLVSLCGDSRCVVKFVAQHLAPPLLDYLTDTAKINMPSWDHETASREVRACQGMAFEAWAFWLYAFIGQLSGNSDLLGHGLSMDAQAVVGPFVLPSKPLASLFLGHSGRGGITSNPSYVSRGLFATKRYTFTRPVTSISNHSLPKAGFASTATKELNLPVREMRNPLRSKKRKRYADILQSFST